MVETSGHPPDLPAAQPAFLTLSLTESQIFTTLGQFLLSALPEGFRILQGLQNRTPPPIGSFATMTIIHRERLATNSHHTTEDGSYCIEQPLMLRVLINFFGPQAGDAATCLDTLFRDAWATAWFRTHSTDLEPLHVTPPRQTPFHTAENQYEPHWDMELSLQAVIRLSLPRESALHLEAHVFPFS